MVVYSGLELGSGVFRRRRSCVVRFYYVVFFRSRSFVSVMISLWRFGRRRWSVSRIILDGGLRRVRCASITRSSFLRFVSSASCRSVCRGE